MRELSSDLGSPQRQPTLIKEDNQSTIAMAKNPQFHGRAKHINIKYHFVREHVNDGKICLEYCPTEHMLADVLTKGIGPEMFERLRKMCGMCKSQCQLGRSVDVLCNLHCSEHADT